MTGIPHRLVSCREKNNFFKSDILLIERTEDDPIRSSSTIG